MVKQRWYFIFYLVWSTPVYPLKPVISQLWLLTLQPQHKMVTTTPRINLDFYSVEVKVMFPLRSIQP